MAGSKSMMGSKRSSDIKTVTKEIVTQVAKQLKSNVPRASQSKVAVARPTLAPFRGVSSVGMAPVTIGNTIRSVKQAVTQTRNGVRVVGRDFVLAVGGTASTISTWTLQGGFGLSPICLNATGLRGYFQTYEQFKWNAVNVHYITSSPTSATGDVLITYHANHGGPKVDHTSTNFMSYALSTDSALLGPQWTNHSVQIISGDRDYYLTDVLAAEDVMHQADGEVLIYTRNTTQGTSPDQPGYVLIDYDVTFERRMLNPRVQSLPSSLFKLQAKTFHVNGVVAAGDTISFDMGSTAGTYDGALTTLPVGLAIGDIFQVIFDIAVGPVPAGNSYATGFQAPLSTGIKVTYPITTGTTLYAVCGSATGVGAFALYSSYTNALVGNNMTWTGAGLTTIACPLIVCCVGSITPAFAQANIG